MDRRTFHEVPKAELHVHLEGAMRPERVLAIAESRDDHPWKGLTVAALSARFAEAAADFPTFIDQFMTGYGLLSERDHFQMVTEDLCAEFERQGVVEAQVLYSPGVHFQQLGVPLAAIHDGIEAGLARFPRLKVAFILDTVINLGFDWMSRTLEAALADRRDWLKGFSIGGGDPDLDMTTMLPLFHRAHEAGLFCVAHAGEVDGAANIATLIRETDVLRIAHGCTAVRDETVMDLLRNRSVVVDVSVTSNLFTGSVASIEAHPLRRFLEHGIRVTINTDDPLYFGTDLYREYLRIHEEIGLDWSTLRGLMDQSLVIAAETR